jgi:hypothetical protein
MRWCTRDGHRDHCRSDATKKTVAAGANLAVGTWQSGLGALLERIGPAFRRIETRRTAKCPARA